MFVYLYHDIPKNGQADTHTQYSESKIETERDKYYIGRKKESERKTLR